MRTRGCLILLFCLLPMLARAEALEVTIGALRFTPPGTMTVCEGTLPPGTVYAARDADGRWAMAVVRETARRSATPSLEALEEAYQGAPGVTVGARYRQAGVEYLPLWEHRPDGDAPYTIHMTACVAGGALYRFLLIDRAAGGVDAPYPREVFAGLHPRFTKEDKP